MDKKQIVRAMTSAAESYSWLIHNSINVAISLNMDTDTLKKVIDEWIQIRHTIIYELIEQKACIL